MIRKFKAKEAKEKQAATLKASPPQSVVAVGSSSSAVDDDWDISDGSLEIIQREDAPLSVFSLAPTIEERATGFFVANFVLGMSGPSKGYLDYLTDVTRTQVLDDGLLSSSMCHSQLISNLPVVLCFQPLPSSWVFRS